jgi:hypothetical protein
MHTALRIAVVRFDGQSSTQSYCGHLPTALVGRNWKPIELDWLR